MQFEAMNNIYKLLLVIALSLIPLCFAVKSENNEAFQNKLHLKHLVSPYPIAGPQPGKPLPKYKPEASQTPGLELSIPGLIGPAGIQFSNYAFASFLALIYSAVIPTFFWLSFTARVALMKDWYSAFNIGLIVFAIILNLTIEYPLIFCAALSIAGAAVGYAGFLYPNYAFVPISVWGAYVAANLLHVLIGATEATNYYGLGGYVWLIYIMAVLLYFMYSLIEAKFESNAQAFLTAFTCAYAVVAGLSFLLKYFFYVSHSPFDLVSFVELPIQFRWDDPVCVMLLVLLVAITIFGYFFHQYRESFYAPSPGFSSGNKALFQAIVPDLIYKHIPFFSSNEASKSDKEKFISTKLQGQNREFRLNLMETSVEQKESFSIVRRNSLFSTDCEDNSPTNNSEVEGTDFLSASSKQLYVQDTHYDSVSANLIV